MLVFYQKVANQQIDWVIFGTARPPAASRDAYVSTVAIVDVQANTAYALSSQQTMPDDGNRVVQYCNQLKTRQGSFKELGIKYIATDGFYTKEKFLDAVESLGLFQIGKLRHDANLAWPYEGEYSGKGRPRKYDGKVDQKAEELLGWNLCQTEDDGTQLYQAKLYLR